MSTKVNYLTKEGYEKLVAELHRIKKVDLPEILERLSEAKAMGDLSENFEYKSALEDKDFAHTRINEIEELIYNVEIIQEEKTKSKKGDEVVDYGSRVKFFVEGDKEYVADVVGTGEAGLEGDNIKISLESPLGISIRGKKVGDTTKMRLSTGRVEVKILDID